MRTGAPPLTPAAGQEAPVTPTAAHDHEAPAGGSFSTPNLRVAGFSEPAIHCTGRPGSAPRRARMSTRQRKSSRASGRGDDNPQPPRGAASTSRAAEKEKSELRKVLNYERKHANRRKPNDAAHQGHHGLPQRAKEPHQRHARRVRTARNRQRQQQDKQDERHHVAIDRRGA